jgi:hypothetical protein
MTETPEYIDFTPPGLKTPEGAAKVNRALDDFNDSTHEVANFFVHNKQELLSGTGNNLEVVKELEALLRTRTEKQDAFLNALSGR